MVKRGKKFFKVYLPGQSTRQLRIPPAFVKEFNGTIPSKSTIMNHGRRQWRVEMSMIDNNLYFQNGWHKFVRDNTLEYEDFLVFCYVGSSMFYVKIFGKSGCLKKVPIPTGKTTQKSLTVFQENQTFKPRKSKERGKQIAIEENDGARKAATKFDSAYPFFQLVIKPSYSAEIKGCFLNIPFRFKEYMEKGKENAVLQVSTKTEVMACESENLSKLPSQDFYGLGSIC
ncbi:putative B3 domain-containing protein At5g66980 [Cornus florida]|uniref:putative B3 domain-containing protein At5g66980 n=1 Tax=Cornus florida TaxID=4283 RepID=UPI00289756C4|nr:putative B3 domain-containing protein At5g66980 [Cornus florida]